MAALERLKITGIKSVSIHNYSGNSMSLYLEDRYGNVQDFALQNDIISNIFCTHGGPASHQGSKNGAVHGGQSVDEPSLKA